MVSDFTFITLKLFLTAANLYNLNGWTWFFRKSHWLHFVNDKPKYTGEENTLHSDFTVNNVKTTIQETLDYDFNLYLRWSNKLW